jgi:hypothetical protein
VGVAVPVGDSVGDAAGVSGTASSDGDGEDVGAAAAVVGVGVGVSADDDAGVGLLEPQAPTMRATTATNP